MSKPLIQIFTVLYFSLILCLFTACQPSDLSKKALMQQTSAFLEKEDSEAAIELLEKNIKAYEQDVDILELLAKSHLQADDPDGEIHLAGENDVLGMVAIKGGLFDFVPVIVNMVELHVLACPDVWPSGRP